MNTDYSAAPAESELRSECTLNPQTGESADINEFKEVCSELIDLFIKKNKNYGSSIFKSPLLAEKISPEDNVLCRLSDKVNRLSQLYAGEPDRVGESLDDTITDTINYLIILKVIRRRNGRSCNRNRES